MREGRFFDDENLCHDPCAVAAAKFDALDQVRAIISLPKN